MLGHQQGKVGVFGLFLLAFIAVPIDRNNAVGIFVDHNTVGIHTESTHVILKLFRAVHDLALIQLVRKMRKNHSWQFYSYAQIHSVGFCRNIQLLTDLFHPFAAASAYRYDTFFAAVAVIAADDAVAFLFYADGLHRCIKEEIYSLTQLFIQILQHDIIDVRAQVADRRIQKL